MLSVPTTCFEVALWEAFKFPFMVPFRPITAPKLQPRFGLTPVFLTALGGSVDALEILLSARCDPHKTTSRALFCESATTIAARTGKTEVLKTLLLFWAGVLLRFLIISIV